MKNALRKIYTTIIMLAFAFCLTACGVTAGSQQVISKPAASQSLKDLEAKDSTAQKIATTKTQTTKALGAMSPDTALTYMKSTPNLVIVEVNAPEWKLSTGITGAMWIPYTEMAVRYNEIPEGKPVLLHCGGGIVSVKAYEILQKMRPDIPELSYIAGAPPVSAYNKWLANH